MKLAHKIIMLILIQIIIIITSFLIIAYLESQKTLTGHMINIAGKNRVLASQVEIEMYSLVSERHVHEPLPDVPRTDSVAASTVSTRGVFDALEALEENIYILKNGGSISGVEIPPISSQFTGYWQAVADGFKAYQEATVILVMKEDLTLLDFASVKSVGSDVIALSDMLTEEIGRELELFTFQMIILQILLGVINVATHIIMIWMILRILRADAQEKIKEEKFVVLGEFASILAHDMRNPLGTIYNSIQLISKNIHDDRGKKEVNRINRSINRMTHQIEGVLNYVKIPNLDLKIHTVRDMLESCQSDMEVPNNVKLSLPANNTTIYCDEKKINFVFTNMILNAIQAIGSDAGHINISIKAQEDQAMIIFENSGASIPVEHLEVIFEPLFSTKMHGTGLGLVSCKNIIEVHGGTISVKNDPVTFTITLPRRGMDG